MFCKKIGVCHGKKCGPAGASRIKEILEETYAARGVEITEQLCCGRCENNNSIVIDDSVTISRLSPANIQEQFIGREEAAIIEAKIEEARIREELDRVLDDLLPMP